MAFSQLLPLTEGEIIFEGNPIVKKNQLEFRRQIAMVLQEPLLMDASVYDNIASGLRFRGVKRPEIEKKVNEWLQAFKYHQPKRKAHKLSGGEAQRVSLARALCLAPKILFLIKPSHSVL